MRTSSKIKLVILALARTISSTAYAAEAAPAPASPPPSQTIQQGAPATAPATAKGQQVPVYKQGESVASLAVALGGLNGAAGSTVVPPLVLSFDYGMHPDISVGGMVSYYRSSYSYGISGFGGGEWNYSYLAVGARGDYHFGRFVPVEKLDLYGGLLLAYGIVSVSAPSGLGVTGAGSSANIFIWGVNLGGRYFFTPSLAAQVELGVGFGNLSAGLSYKF
jgi:hypothetical protein